jgi:hypothetical protein
MQDIFCEVRLKAKKSHSMPLSSTSTKELLMKVCFGNLAGHIHSLGTLHLWYDERVSAQNIN